jgi:hypothetical protein
VFSWLWALPQIFMQSLGINVYEWSWENISVLHRFSFGRDYSVICAPIYYIQAWKRPRFMPIMRTRSDWAASYFSLAYIITRQILIVAEWLLTKNQPSTTHNSIEHSVVQPKQTFINECEPLSPRHKTIELDPTSVICVLFILLLVAPRRWLWYGSLQPRCLNFDSAACFLF